MTKPADYSTYETLRDGRVIHIRALRPQDRDAMLAALARTGTQSLFRRFFGPRRAFSETEIRFFMNVDFVDHVAIVAEARRTESLRSSAARDSSSSMPKEPKWRLPSSTRIRDMGSGRS